jgi:hypothetical protein
LHGDAPDDHRWAGGHGLTRQSCWCRRADREQTATHIDSEQEAKMSGPFIFIASNRLKPGASEAERRRVPGLVDFIEGERAASAYAETLDATTRIQVFGSPSDGVLEMLRVQAGAGVPLTVHAEHLGGFTRIGR